MRKFLNIIESAQRISTHPLGTREELRQLEDALCLWVEGRMHEAEPHLLRLVHLCAPYRPTVTLNYVRGFVLDWGPEGYGDLSEVEKVLREGLTVMHQNKALESWSHNEACVDDFVANWEEPAVILNYRWPPESILIDLGLFDEYEQPKTDMAWQEEVIVNVPPRVFYKPQNIVIPPYWRKQLAA